MRKILVPTNFSETSEYALEAASILAKQHKAEIILLHMLGVSDTVFSKDEAKIENEAKYYLKLAKERFKILLAKPYLEGVKVSEIVQNYKIFKEINNVVLEQQVDLIVMSSHGKNSLESIFVGTGTEQVIRSSEVPVLVIKKPSHHFIPKEVVFAFDFKIESLEAYRKAIQMIQVLGANINLVYVNLPFANFKSTAEITEQVKLFMRVAHHGENASVQNITYLNDYTIEQGLFNYANEISADVIAITTHGRRGLSHFFKGSLGEDIAKDAALPVLTIKI